MSPPEVWTAAQLMGNGGAESPANDPMLWGVPGHLTRAETDAFFEFKEEIEKRGGEFRSTVYSFGEEEGEAWALCRWLRARKYVVADVIKMVEQALETRSEPRAKGFYPNPVDALGCDARLFFANYPQLYHGIANNGAVVFFSKPGILSVDGMECITTLEGILRFHWHIMMHDFSRRLREQKAKDPNFKKFECFCVLDLNGLTMTQLTRKALAIIKEQAAIDSVCFPETMSKMLIINSPSFFATSWRLIKSWLDPRTASKIEVIAGKTASEKRLLELIPKGELPSDYGGTAKDTNSIIMDDFGGDADRMETHIMYLRGHSSHVVEVGLDESVTITVYTRSTVGAVFALHDNKQKTLLKDGILALDRSEKEDEPVESRMTVLTENPIEGPASIKIKADSKAGRFSTQNYFLVFAFKNKD